MAKVTVLLSVAPRTFPAGTQEGPIRVTLAKADGTDPIFLESGEVSFVFEDVVPGDYRIIAERMNAAGERLGDPIMQELTIAPTSVDITVPVSMVVSQTP